MLNFTFLFHSIPSQEATTIITIFPLLHTNFFPSYIPVIMAKWRGSVAGVVERPIEQVWGVVSKTKRLPEWMPMVERCTDLEGEEGIPGYVRLVSGFMFPQEDGERSWIKERLVSIDFNLFTYVYKMEASNVGLDGSVNTLKLEDYGDDSTLVNWAFEIDPLEGSSEDTIMDYLGFLYKSCIHKIQGAIEADPN